MLLAVNMGLSFRMLHLWDWEVQEGSMVWYLPADDWMNLADLMDFLDRRRSKPLPSAAWTGLLDRFHLDLFLDL